MFTATIATMLLAAVLAAPTPTPTAPEPIKFGPENAAIWDDNIEASVTSAQIFQPTANASGLTPGQTAVRVTIKITNGRPIPFNLDSAVIRLTSGPDGVQASQVFDAENGLSMGFEGVIAPGRPITAAYGFSVPPDNTQQLNVEITPAENYTTALFEGPAS